ncbi:protein translocase subunit SecF [Fusibacter sp. A1]|uniref:protein translocase subunit SecF n=2 Tax=Fusibacter TaxID=76008 RepID=UPI001FABA1A5|nr:protein translocase subunit SecF [Fusibacter sp. A1]
MKFTKHYKIFFSVSGLIIVLGLVMALIAGFNLGIDFSGGTMIQVEFNQSIDLDEVKDSIKEFNLSPDVIAIGTESNEAMIKTSVSLNNDQRMEVFSKLKSEFDITDDTPRESKQFGPSIGDEIKKRAVYAIILASVGMLLYITFRFEWKFGVAAIIALIHDVLILLSIYAIFRVPVNSAFIAAVLTVVGYSINDTIVVFDRIRDNVKYAKTTNYFRIADDSLNQTVVRSINTSLTTLLVIGALYFLGVESIKELAFPLLAGVAAGTYSSIFIASPVWVLLKNLTKKRAKA